MTSACCSGIGDIEAFNCIFESGIKSAFEAQHLYALGILDTHFVPSGEKVMLLGPTNLS